jgi:hypothetical protein
MEKFMGQFVRQYGERLSRFESGLHNDFAFGRQPKCADREGAVFKLNPSPPHYVFQHCQPRTRVPNRPGKIGQIRSFSLPYVEHVNDAESSERPFRRPVIGRCGCGVYTLLRSVCDRRHNADSLFTFDDLPPKVPPGVESRDVCCIRPLSGDQHHISQAVLGKSGHNF